MKQEKTRIITNYIFKIALSTLFTILVMHETSSWYGFFTNFRDWNTRQTTTCIIELILYIAIITTLTINFIMDIKKKNTRQ